MGGIPLTPLRGLEGADAREAAILLGRHQKVGTTAVRDFRGPWGVDFRRCLLGQCHLELFEQKHEVLFQSVKTTFRSAHEIGDRRTRSGSIHRRTVLAGVLEDNQFGLKGLINWIKASCEEFQSARSVESKPAYDRLDDFRPESKGWPSTWQAAVGLALMCRGACCR